MALCMILNPDKCHYMLLGKDVLSNLLQLCGDDSKSCEPETILGKEIENKQGIQYNQGSKWNCNECRSNCTTNASSLGYAKKEVLFSLNPSWDVYLKN